MTRTKNTHPRKDRLRYHEVYSNDDEEKTSNKSLASRPTSSKSLSDEVVNDLCTEDFVLVRSSSNKNNITHYIGQVSNKYDDGDYV
ncbi:hypothetical protein WA026_015782 [Henosepilachna vigintioctopunctata]|uniref:Uncharacterized protein n=1 Tax=Henosepilachna vigintioctopunctata TaxID=420089 RepID=A0AAW1URV1_9CUCU